MQAVTTIGLDIAKSVFQVHGVDAHGNALVRLCCTTSLMMWLRVVVGLWEGLRVTPSRYNS